MQLCSRNKACQRAFVIVASLLLAAAYFYRKSVQEIVVDALPELTKSVPFGEEVSYTKLSTAGCRQTEVLRVCSHQANAQELRVDNGSLQAYQALWDQGIRCFDIDFMVTKDGFIVATHPQRLQDTIGSAIGDVRQTLADNTVIMIRSLGADDDRFPITDLLFEQFGKLIKETDPKPWLESKSQPNYRAAPTIFVDIKDGPTGDKLKNVVWDVNQHAEKHGVTDHVALYSLTKEHDELLTREGVWRGPKIRGFWDSVRSESGELVPNHIDLAAEPNLEYYQMIGPSIKLPSTFFEVARNTNKPIHSWVVDKPEELFFALEMGVDSVISNVPLATLALVGRWRQGCRARFPLQKGWQPDDD